MPPSRKQTNKTDLSVQYRLNAWRELLLAGATGGGATSVSSQQYMYIGHINLAKSFNGSGKHFVKLVEALQRRGVQQYVLVRNIELAKQLDRVDNVTVGPAVRSAITAYCLMPAVNVVHIHDPSDGQSGLLLTLTRSIPFVLTHRDETPEIGALAKAIYRRAAGIVYRRDADAAKHLRIYRRALESWRSPTASSGT